MKLLRLLFIAALLPSAADAQLLIEPGGRVALRKDFTLTSGDDEYQCFEWASGLRVGKSFGGHWTLGLQYERKVVLSEENYFASLDTYIHSAGIFARHYAGSDRKFRFFLQGEGAMGFGKAYYFQHNENFGFVTPTKELAARVRPGISFSPVSRVSINLSLTSLEYFYQRINRPQVYGETSDPAPNTEQSLRFDPLSAALSVTFNLNSSKK